MSAELHWLYEDTSLNLGQVLHEGEMAWSTDYGDGEGNDVCVLVHEGFTKILKGTLESDEAEEGTEITVSDIEVVAELPVGEPHIRELQKDDGEKMTLFVRNLGVCAEYPDMRPAWN
jgi:hypothetical protein